MLKMLVAGILGYFAYRFLQKRPADASIPARTNPTKSSMESSYPRKVPPPAG